ncbi:MAG: BrnT family toxin [Vulcanimicrobiaceae bacterium]
MRSLTSSGTKTRAIAACNERGFDFAHAARIWAESPVLETSAREVEGERRTLSIGIVEGLTIAVVWTARGNARRILSAHAASRKERRAYHSRLEDENSAGSR